MKKLISLLLVLTMVMSLSAITASAACAHKTCGFVDNGNGTHNSVCCECGKVVVANDPCDVVNGACPSCGYGAVVSVPVKLASPVRILLNLLKKLFC